MAVFLWRWVGSSLGVELGQLTIVAIAFFAIAILLGIQSANHPRVAVPEFGILGLIGA